MPYDFEPKSRRYRGPDGKPVSRHELRSLIDKLLAFTERQARAAANAYEAGTISLTEFHVRMRGLLKSAHIVAASVGRGGRASMQAKDWGKVGAKIKWQYGYLAKFVRKIETGRVPKVLTPYRASLYASSIYTSYANANMAAHLDIIGRDPPGTSTGKEVLARLVQNSKEGCDECNADSALGWVPVDEMGEIGTRLCGDFCLCEIEFSDEVNE